MKKQQNKIDEYFRKALQDHTVMPSEAAKEAFLKEAATIQGSGKSKRYLYFSLVALLLIGVAGAGLLFLHQNKLTPTPSVSSSSSSSSLTLSNIINNKNPNNSIPKKETEPASSSNKKPDRGQNSRNNSEISSIHKNQDYSTRNDIHEKKSSARKVVAEPEISNAETKIAKTINNPTETKTTILSTDQDPPLTNPANEKVRDENIAMNTPPITVPDTVKSDKAPKDLPKTGMAQSQRNWNIALGLNYEPEWLFNTLEGEKYVNNFGIEGTFQFGRYSIRTGAGLSVTKGTNELSIKYNDYLGHYNRLDSIYFSWNETHTKLLPTYYFSNENVWDSLMKTADSKVIKRYTYLQIPLILGYDFWQNEHFSFGLRAGPVFSILLKTEVLSDNYDPGMNKIILINRIAPERISTNWQVLGGFNATYHFSQHFGIELEPGIRYYFNSVYEKSDIDKKPWSAGIHAAFIVIL